MIAPLVTSSKQSISFSLAAISSTAAAVSTVPLMKVFLGRISSSATSSLTLSARRHLARDLIEQIERGRLGQRRQLLAEALAHQLGDRLGVVARLAEQLLRRRLQLLVQRLALGARGCEYLAPTSMPPASSSAAASAARCAAFWRRIEKLAR